MVYQSDEGFMEVRCSVEFWLRSVSQWVQGVHLVVIFSVLEHIIGKNILSSRQNPALAL